MEFITFAIGFVIGAVLTAIILTVTYNKNKTSNDELMTSNSELKKRNEKEIKLWNEILDNEPVSKQDAASDFINYILSNPYSAGDTGAGILANQRVQAEQVKRNAIMKRLQNAFENIGMGGGNDNG